MTTALIIKKTKKQKPPLNPIQKTFNRLKKKIETLKKEQDKHTQTLDTYLKFHNENISPARKQFLDLCTKEAKLIYPHYKNKGLFSNKERALVKRLISDRLETLFNADAINESDEELAMIIQEIVGNRYENKLEEAFETLKAETEEMFAENGVEIDLSDISAADGEEAFFEKLRSSTSDELFEKVFEQMKGEVPPFTKSKKELEKERQENEFAALQKKGMSGIYKQLAKLFHPDLEQDPVLKKEKEDLMKTLTSAYKNADLHTLLSLELKWLGQSSDHIKTRSDDQIKMYNMVLQKQIHSMQQEMEMALLHPKYNTIHRFTYFGSSQIMECMQETFSSMKRDIKSHLQAVKELESAQAVELIRNSIRSHRN